MHRAVTYRPITRYDVPGGYLNMPGLTAHDPNLPDPTFADQRDKESS